MDVTVGELIHLRREQVGMSRRRLSLDAQLSESYVSKLEAGELEPSLNAFARIAKVLRFHTYEIAWLVRMEATRPKGVDGDNTNHV